MSASTQQGEADIVGRARFMQFVERGPEPDACWIWTGRVDPVGGYGLYTMDCGVEEWAHRAAWWLLHGRIPHRACVLHACDVRLCVRHLFLGTRTDNAADRNAKGRTSKGEKHSAAIRAAWARRKGATA